VTARYSDRIIAVSDVCRDGLVRCGVPPGKIDVILNGTPPLPRLSETERAALRAARGVAEGDFLVGILARIEPYKGHMYLLEAAERLLGQGRKIKILVAGTGEYEREVRARARTPGVADAVEFLGFVEEPAPFLGILDAQVNASTVEATSLSLLEGMSIGLPAVASDDGGNTRVIRDGENGLVFKSRDSARLADCLARLMDDAALRDKLGAGALEIYAREFTGDRTARETENTYRKVWENHHGK
jgi:glycosyltransferase involved in cell wall biosynthesis